MYSVVHGNRTAAFGWQIGMFDGVVPNANASRISQAVTTGCNYFKILNCALCMQSADGICLLPDSKYDLY